MIIRKNRKYKINVIGIIPARFASSRFPGKPLAQIHKKAMIMHVYDRAKNAELLTDLYVATDDDRIRLAVENNGGKVIMTRAAHSSGTDRIAEAILKIKGDIIINIQGDEPLVEPQMINQLAEPLIKSKTVLMTTLKTKIRDLNELENPNIVKVITDKNDNALYFSRANIPYPKNKLNKINQLTKKQQKDNVTMVYFKHIGLYGYRRNFLLQFSQLPQGQLEQIEELEQLRVLEYGYSIKVIETQFDTIAVDTPADLIKVEKLIKNIV